MQKIIPLLALAALLAATLPAQAQVDATPPARESAEDIARRMAERRAQQLLNNPNPSPPSPRLRAPAPAPPAAPASAPAPAAPLLTDAAWQALLTRLASPTFAEREAAQKQLDQFTWRTLDELKSRAATATDPEAAARLAARITAIEDLMAYDPPPISLDLKNASLFDTVKALEKATGETSGTPPVPPNNGVPPRNLPAQELYTLSSPEIPFWEAYRDLDRQHALSVRAISGTFSLARASSATTLNGTFGGLATFTIPIARVVPAPPRAGAAVAPLAIGPPTYRFQFSLALDPRIKPVKYKSPRLLHVVDDAGNVLLASPADTPVSWTINSTFRVFTSSNTLPIPQNPGKSIASATGEFRLIIQLAAITLDVADVEKKLNQPLAVGNERITISQFGSDKNSFRFQATRADFARDPALPLTLTLLDANDRPLFSNPLQAGLSASIATNNAPGPYTLRLSLPTKTRDVTIPFELKNLPLPGP